MGKNINEEKHENYCEILVRALKEKGYTVKSEVVLPYGRGAADVVFYDSEGVENVVEVKGQPTSLRCKKVTKQLNKYLEFFGEKANYFIGFPQHQGALVLQEASTGAIRRLEDL